MKWLLPIVAWLLSLFASREEAKKEGKTEAEREQTDTINTAVNAANEARTAADKAHAENVGDEAFDSEFRRS